MPINAANALRATLTQRAAQPRTALARCRRESLVAADEADAFVDGDENDGKNTDDVVVAARAGAMSLVVEFVEVNRATEDDALNQSYSVSNDN